MNIFQRLTIYFRNQYLDWQRAYSIDDLPKKLDDLDIYNELPKWLVDELEAIIKVYKPKNKKKLYLIKFDKKFTTDQAERELSLLGLLPANIVEIVLFVNKYSKTVNERPIIALNSYHDYSKAFKEILKTYSRPPKYDLCVCYTSLGFERPGEIESCEAMNGAVFSIGTTFIAKSF